MLLLLLPLMQTGERRPERQAGASIDNKPVKTLELEPWLEFKFELGARSLAQLNMKAHNYSWIADYSSRQQWAVAQALTSAPATSASKFVLCLQPALAAAASASASANQDSPREKEMQPSMGQLRHSLSLSTWSIFIFRHDSRFGPPKETSKEIDSNESCSPHLFASWYDRLRFKWIQFSIGCGSPTELLLLLNWTRVYLFHWRPE